MFSEGKRLQQRPMYTLLKFFAGHLAVTNDVESLAPLMNFIQTIVFPKEVFFKFSLNVGCERLE